MELHRPLGQLALTTATRSRFCNGLWWSETHGPGTGAAAAVVMGCCLRLRNVLMYRSRFTLGSQMFLNSGFIKLIRLAFLDLNGIPWALAQTSSQAVAQVIRRQYRFAVNQFDSTLSARRHTESASVAFIRVNCYNFSQHGYSPFGCFGMLKKVMP
jgi:hypothetical protein